MSKPIDWGLFDRLCAIQCTLSEIAAVLGCSEDTIERRCVSEQGMRFKELYAAKRGVGRVSLRRLQWQAAENGNPAMLIWLGKNVLGQSDMVRAELGVSDWLVERLRGMTDAELDEEIRRLDAPTRMLGEVVDAELTPA